MKQGVSLADWTTLGVGGPARYFAEVDAPGPSLAWARAEGLPVLPLGQGSNLLVADSGFDGLVLRCTAAGVRVVNAGDRVHVVAEAGVVWDDLVARAVQEGWAGIESLSGIPGCVGAAPTQNIGAYGQELAEVLVRVRAIDMRDGEVRDFDREACELGYRTSRFKHGDENRWLLTEVELALTPGDRNSVTYGELLSRVGDIASLAEARAAVLELRREKSMLWDAADPNGRSAGSFFVNPVVSAEQAERAARNLGEDAPRFVQPDGRVKLSAAWLIERCGFARGYSDGPVGLSGKHALAIVNRGGARAADVLGLAARIRDAVREATGIELVPEVALVGFGAQETL